MVRNNSLVDNHHHRLSGCCHKTSHTFHAVKLLIWTFNGLFFEADSLQNLGLIFYVGHPGDQYPNRISNSHCSVQCVHTSGVQSISIEFCFCPNTSGTHPEDSVQYSLQHLSTQKPSLHLRYFISSTSIAQLPRNLHMITVGLFSD